LVNTFDNDLPCFILLLAPHTHEKDLWIRRGFGLSCFVHSFVYKLGA
jgi:hypothetical protein